MPPRWVGRALLGLAEAGHNEPLAPRPAALPLVVAMVALRYRRLAIAYAPSLRLCTAVRPAGGPAAAASTWWYLLLPHP